MWYNCNGHHDYFAHVILLLEVMEETSLGRRQDGFVRFECACRLLVPRQGTYSPFYLCISQEPLDKNYVTRF